MSATFLSTNATDTLTPLSGNVPAANSRFALRVGGVSVGVSGPADMRLALEPALLDFEVPDRSCDIEISASWADHLERPASSKLFESGGLWTACRERDEIAFYFATDYLGKVPYKAAWFDRTFTCGRVALLRRYFNPRVPVYPLEYPLDELLVIHRLSLGEGVEVHACGLVSEDGVGRLFVGHSGAGKSTTSRLWMKQPGVRVLSDDRIILRATPSGLRMYGTPWHGDAGLAAQASAPVDAIFLLEHAPRNEFIGLDGASAAAELFVRTFVPHHSGESIAHVLHFWEQAVRRVPVRLLRFLPNQSAVEAILRAA